MQYCSITVSTASRATGCQRLFGSADPAAEAVAGAVYGCAPVAGNPARVTLTRQSLAVVSVSYEALLDGLALPLAKYRPLTPSTSGEEASGLGRRRAARG